MNAVGRILDTQWISSSARSLRAEWKNYEALYQHFKHLRMQNTKAQYRGLKKRLRETNLNNHVSITHVSIYLPTVFFDLSIYIYRSYFSICELYAWATQIKVNAQYVLLPLLACLNDNY